MVRRGQVRELDREGKKGLMKLVGLGLPLTSLMLGAICLEFVSGGIWLSGSFIVSSSPSHELW